MQELEQKIHDFIRMNYQADYKGRLEVNKIGNIYTFLIGLPSYMSPTTISCEANSDEEFLEFIYKELKIRNYVRLDFYEVKRTEHRSD